MKTMDETVVENKALKSRLAAIEGAVEPIIPFLEEELISLKCIGGEMVDRHKQNIRNLIAAVKGEV